MHRQNSVRILSLELIDVINEHNAGENIKLSSIKFMQIIVHRNHSGMNLSLRVSIQEAHNFSSGGEFFIGEQREIRFNAFPNIF